MSITKTKSINERALFWAPRILGIAFILFLAIFALDVFIPGKSIGYYFVALIIHLIPNFVLSALLFFAWKHEKIGGMLFILIGLFFTLFFRNYLEPMNFFIVSFPVFLIGLLFLAHNILEAKKK